MSTYYSFTGCRDYLCVCMCIFYAVTLCRVVTYVPCVCELSLIIFLKNLEHVSPAVRDYLHRSVPDYCGLVARVSTVNNEINERVFKTNKNSVVSNSNAWSFL